MALGLLGSAADSCAGRSIGPGMARTLSSLKDIELTRITGIGPAKAEALETKLEPPIENVYDLVTHYPRRYLDRTHQAAIRDLQVGEEATVLATVKRVTTKRTRNGKTYVEIDVFDGASYLQCTFFGQPWIAKQVANGTEVMVFGKLEMYRGRRRLAKPVLDLVGDRTGRII